MQNMTIHLLIWFTYKEANMRFHCEQQQCKYGDKQCIKKVCLGRLSFVLSSCAASKDSPHNHQRQDPHPSYRRSLQCRHRHSHRGCTGHWKHMQIHWIRMHPRFSLVLQKNQGKIEFQNRYIVWLRHFNENLKPSSSRCFRSSTVFVTKIPCLVLYSFFPLFTLPIMHDWCIGFYA